ncbi:MAG: DUF2807 domain-containing protein [Pedobacter sp.]|uniref:GIN domain-containing protein n=1 Tax=Pedobacter sp. TaxID=1411316 RepID=UPI00339A2646
MKTLFNTVLKSGSLAIILLASVFTLNASAATGDTFNPATKTVTVNMGHPTPDIRRVIVTGNTKVLLVQSTKEYVTMDAEDLEKVSVTQIGNALTISSGENTPVVVTVYVKNPYRIDGSGKADVRTVGNFNLTYLQVLLKDDATARVKATTQGLYTVIDDRANLQLLGTSGKHIYEMAGIAKMNIEKFAATETQNNKALTEAVALNIKGRSN